MPEYNLYGTHGIRMFFETRTMADNHGRSYRNETGCIAYVFCFVENFSERLSRTLRRFSFWNTERYKNKYAFSDESNKLVRIKFTTLLFLTRTSVYYRLTVSFVRNE